jgi:hypothetical protein
MRSSSPIFGVVLRTNLRVSVVPHTNLECILTFRMPLRRALTRTPLDIRSIVSLSSKTLRAIPRGLPQRPLRTPPLQRSISKMSTTEAQNGLNGLNGTTGLSPAEASQKQINAWSGPGPAAFDFRSILNFSQLKRQITHSCR